jgi:hypothetical protein
MQLELAAKLNHLAPRFIMGLSDETQEWNYDNSVTRIERSDEFLDES